MIVYKSKDFSIGLKVEIDGMPYIILENKFVNPGKGQAFNKLKLKSIISDSIIVKTIKIGEKLKSADVFLMDVDFLYQDNDIFFFLDVESSDYHEISIDLIGKNKNWIKEGLVCSLVLWNDDVVAVNIPRFVELKVISTENIAGTSVVSKNSKYSELETGMKIKVPMFIKDNDIIRIDTEKGIYISRVI